MAKTYYHATPFENLQSILEKGILRGCDGVVYLTEKPDEALRFLRIRFYNDLLVCEVKLNENKVEESFDHNEAFFKCKAYAYSEDINPTKITNMYRYKF